MQPANPVNPPQDLPLRDIHLPAAPGWWPPAPGWWLLIVLLLVVFLLLWLLWRRAQRLRYRRQALHNLAQLEKRECSVTSLITELSMLLRRSALCAFPEENCAALSGESWLEFLDRQLTEKSFTTGVGRCLADGPYQPTVEVDRDALLALCRRWLKSLPPTPRSRRKG